LGIDFTARDLQNQLKSKGLPWELAKGFDSSAVFGKWLDISSFNLRDLHFSLEKNGQEVQRGHTKDMIFGVDQLIAFVSQFFMIKIGDVLFTGTPSGVGPIEIGDQLTGYIEGEKNFNFKIK
jgi:2-keto-4-pentenoate hydratase/2-oxohepta-3-ene-1,7-dioic acid hydratase in catechol pathway